MVFTVCCVTCRLEVLKSAFLKISNKKGIANFFRGKRKINCTLNEI